MTENEHTQTSDWYSNETATFGDRLAAAREAVGLSQSDLARKLGVKIKTVTSWEEDTAEPRANKLQMLSGILNVSIIWLLSGEGEGVAAPDEATALDADVSSLLAEVRQIRSGLAQMADRLGVAEKKLRKALKEAV